MAIIYGLGKTRITCYASDKTTPTKRYTLEREKREGLQLIFKPEGVLHEQGGSANWAREWSHRGFRPSLLIKWDVAMPLGCTVETYASGWGAPATIALPLALTQIYSAALATAPCLIEPHLDKSYSFLAQPDPTKNLNLQDIKGVVHSRLELDLIGKLVAAMPDFS